VDDCWYLGNCCLDYLDCERGVMRDTVVRAVRTFIQGFVGVLALLLVPFLNDLISSVSGGGEVELDVNFLQSIGVAAVAGGIIALVAFAQNWIEESTNKTTLK
jgi:predicted phage tail protein